MDCSATIIEKQLDATQYFNHTGKATPKETVPGYERATAWVSIGGSLT